MTTYRKAFAWTAIPIVALSIISTAGAFGQDPWASYPPGTPNFLLLVFFVYLVWFVAALWWGASVLISIVLFYARIQQVAAGIRAGIGVGILSLGATCVANNATVGGF